MDNAKTYVNYLSMEIFQCSFENSGLHIPSSEWHRVWCNRHVGKTLHNVLINVFLLEYDPDLLKWSDLYHQSNARGMVCAHSPGVPRIPWLCCALGSQQTCWGLVCWRRVCPTSPSCALERNYAFDWYSPQKLSFCRGYSTVLPFFWSRNLVCVMSLSNCKSSWLLRMLGH